MNINLDVMKKDLKRFPILILGLVILSLGIHLTRLSTLGLNSWGVFHEGLAFTLDMTFGVVTKIVGFVILVLSMVFLKTKIGIGTILNILIIGTLLDYFEKVYPVMDDHRIRQVIVLILGVLFTTFGRSLYIASRLGPGPRDGVFVGLSRILKVRPGIIKIIIEFIVLGIGIYLGGTWGIGTAIIIVISGYLVQFFFMLYGYDPRKMKQRNISDYAESQFAVKIVDVTLLVLVFLILAFDYLA